MFYFFLRHWKWIISTAIAVIGLFYVGSVIHNTNKSLGDQSPAIQNSQNVEINYANTRNPSYLNPRKNNLLNLSAIEIVKKYFDLLNQNSFQAACSLLPKNKCDSIDGEIIADFSNERMKYLNGYETLSVWDPKVEGFRSKIICAKYSYILKNDLNPEKIYEIFSFYLDEREDGEWQITSRVCEKKFKEGAGERNCPFAASKKFCSDS